MKQHLFLSLIFLSLLSACVYDSLDDCGTVNGFMVNHDGCINEFEMKVGNDVHLYIYEERISVFDAVLSYSSIKNGQVVWVSQDEHPVGTYEMVAWAVNRQDEEGGKFQVPPYVPNKKYEEKKIALLPGHDRYYYPLPPLYKAEFEVEINHQKDSLYEVSLKDCLCQIYFTLHDADLFSQDEKIWIELEGTHSEMTFDYKYAGEEAIVYRELKMAEEENKYISNRMGVLPSSPEQCLAVTVYQGSNPLFRLKTEENSVAGKVIELEVRLRNQFSVLINGWQIRNYMVEYF